MRSALETALAFVDRINAHDVEGVCALTTEDGLLVDSLRAIVKGRESLRVAWRSYFAMFPDYRIEVTATFSDAPRTALFGRTIGTFAPSGRRVELFAAWLATVDDDKLAEWSVHADQRARARRCTHDG